MLVVAGRDPIGGAGIDADRAGAEGLAIDVYCVVTAETQQDARSVRSIGARSVASWWTEALRFAGEGLDALKLGLLPGEDHIAAAAELIDFVRRHEPRRVVLDPVISASSGSRFLSVSAVDTLRSMLCTRPVVVSPNVLEAAELTRRSADELAGSSGARLQAAGELLDLGAEAVVLKGGHALEDPATDLVLARGSSPVWLAHPRIPGGKIRGSGCRFATRMAAELALGRDLVAAAKLAGDHVLEAIRPSPPHG